VKHNHDDGTERKAVLCNMGQFENLSADDLLRKSARRKKPPGLVAQVTPLSRIPGAAA
jgi:hypothetical protein